MGSPTTKTAQISSFYTGPNVDSSVCIDADSDKKLMHDSMHYVMVSGIIRGDNVERETGNYLSYGRHTAVVVVVVQ